MYKHWNKKIDLLHREFYELLCSNKGLSGQAKQTFEQKRPAALKFIQNVILEILEKAKPEEIDRPNFDKAGKILSLHRNAPTFTLFSCFSSSSRALENPAYLKHQTHFDSLQQQQP